MYLPGEGRLLKDTWSVLLILPAIFLFLCSPPTLWAFVPDDLGFVITGQEGGGRTTPGGKTFTNSIGMKFVQIPPGTFMMGSPSSESGRDSDETQHQVTLTKPFYLQTTEVTQGQWKAAMGTTTSTQGCLFPVKVQVPNNPSHFSNCGDNCPVEQVSWSDCQEFIRKLNRREGNGTYRLPTEAEWEYACRAGTTGPYYEDLARTGWYDNNSGGRTHPVAQKASNAWGLYDMYGNVWEWCGDWYGRYSSGFVTNPEGPSSGQGRVIRGGGWDSDVRYCRSADRYIFPPVLRYSGNGFRIAWTE